MRVPLWFMRTMATSNHLLPGIWRSAGKPWTDAPRVRMIFLACASRMPSCQRWVVAVQSAVCCQWRSMMSKYSVCEVRRISSKRFCGSTPSSVVTLCIS